MSNFILVAALTITTAASGHAQSPALSTTDGLASACRLYVSVTENTQHSASADQYTQIGFCIGYVAGFAHALSLAARGDICLPETINLSDAVKAFLKYVDQHPEEAHLSAKITLPRALEGAFPCKSR